MAGYVELDEVRTWYDELSSGSSRDPELSPAGPDHCPVVSAKLAHLNWEEPTLTPLTWAGVSSRTLDFLATDTVLTLAPVRRAGRMPSQGETR